MDISLMIIEVDGTLRNPVVVAALAAWCSVIAVVAVAFGISVARGDRSARLRLLLVIVLVALEPIAVRGIGMMIYVISSREITSVGFWGSPPFWIPVAVAALFAIASFATVRLRGPQHANASR